MHRVNYEESRVKFSRFQGGMYGARTRPAESPPFPDDSAPAPNTIGVRALGGAGDELWGVPVLQRQGGRAVRHGGARGRKYSENILNVVCDPGRTPAVWG